MRSYTPPARVLKCSLLRCLPPCAAPASDGGASDGGDGSEGGADPDAMSYEELTALGEVVGTVSTGISAAQLAALPVRTFAGCGGGGGGGGGGEGEEQ
jgi:E3 ubiquitin-protein ligase BIG BROTHER-like protein